MKERILVVEDDSDITQILQIYLSNQGYEVQCAANGEQALQQMEACAFDLAIVDVMMPVMDGITLVMKARERYDLPIIFLSAKSEDIDKITGLNVGADDYVTKPFVPMELVARVQAQLRRYHRYGRKEPIASEGCYRVRGLELNVQTRQVLMDGEEIRVTPLEFGILELLIASPGVVFSAAQIYEQVWKETAVSTETVMVHVRNLREKIEPDPRNPQYLKVVWGVGYKLER